ncbi:MAG: hypothetical protein HY006_01605 [Candidatus Sungbacteria bacterium]|nr:hypothetical protein [Candidatus Sungbacteria bacterium]
MEKETVTKKPSSLYPAILTGAERLVALRRIRGMWKDRKPDPVKELEKMRREWDRKIV